MAAEIRPFPGASGPQKLQLASKLEGHQDVVNAAVILKGEDGVISISDDKTVRIWLKRDVGSYWPSVCHIMPAPASCMHFHDASRRLFVGMDNGSVTEFLVADDYNRMSQTRNYAAHQGRVAQVVFSADNEWLLSVAKDKFLFIHCTESGRRLVGYPESGVCTSLQFDVQSKTAFVGDEKGQILMLKHDGSNLKLMTTLKGHMSAIRCLRWEAERQMLFSGSFDRSIVCWDIGGKKGTTYELQGHRGKVTSLYYVPFAQRLLSAGEDSVVVSWCMRSKRKETPEWAESDYCQKCSKPFFWNLKAMYDQKRIGLRQHHCRRCGKAVCDSCSANRSTLPALGHEFLVRVCDECNSLLTTADKASQALFFDAKHAVTHIDFDESKNLLLTSGYDRVIKLWEADGLLEETRN